jgi:hypothetical protein
VTGQTLVRPPGPTNSLGPRHFGGTSICARAKAGLHAKPLQHPGRAGVTRNRMRPNIVAARWPALEPTLHGAVESSKASANHTSFQCGIGQYHDDGTKALDASERIWGAP